MDNELHSRLETQVTLGAAAYVRNLAAAEAAVVRGQFNLAKVLRALAHSQRVLAMGAARLLAAENDPAAALGTISAELEAPSSAGASNAVAVTSTLLDGPANRTVRERAHAIA